MRDEDYQMVAYVAVITLAVWSNFFFPRVKNSPPVGLEGEENSPGIILEN